MKKKNLVNKFKGLANVSRSAFPDGSKNIQEWRKNRTREAFNNWALTVRVGSLAK